MATARLLMLLALLACLMAATFARAEEDDFDAEATANVEEEEEPEDDLMPEANQATQFMSARATFADYADSSALKLPAGEKVSTFVTVQNKVGGAASEVFIVAAHLNMLGNPEGYVQNFSAVRSMRTVNGGETATVQYEFRPDAMLEPMDYNLVVRVFYLNEENATFIAVAYNSTVSITDPLGTDFKAITTWFILAALIGGAVYMFTGKSDPIVAAGKKPASSVAASSAITDEKVYNAEYISAEHLKFREQLMKQQNGGAKKNKK